MNEKERKALIDYAERTAKAMGESAICLSLFTDDYKNGIDALLQFALALMLDKPIYLMAPLGVEVPEKVRRVADGIEYFDMSDPETAKTAAAKLILRAMDDGRVEKKTVQ